ncbi:ABC transporter ATP-binding protein [Tumebacillus lipolyticus]|uniref:ABC transporter ATP-binding protein n=1 Tax=Tumebacillus lipolyticus TaxID=1280370 RepID=A0ABW5A1F4_9BACL
MEKTIIHAEQISKSYQIAEREITVLQDISFEIEEGSMVALLGPSGSGKTTLLNILGLITEPTTGNLRLSEYDIAGKKLDRNKLRRSLIGYIFQQFHLLPQFNALQNVCLPLVPERQSNVEVRAAELLERVGLDHRLTHLPSELSGGEQQRVAIARALIGRPKILLCDEPTGNLDTGTRDSILELLSKLKEEGLSIIIATHDVEVANRCNYTLVIRDGHLIREDKD